jgi:hypothetical protein
MNQASSNERSEFDESCEPSERSEFDESCEPSELDSVEPPVRYIS